LAAVETKITSPRRLRFRDVDIWVPQAPCGAVTQLQILNIWQKIYPNNPPTEDTSERLERLAHASWHAFADRYHWLADSEFVQVPEQGLLSDTYAKFLAKYIINNEPPPRCNLSSDTPWNYFAGYAAHNPWVHEGNDLKKHVQWSPVGCDEPTEGTTHVSVIDENGMSVSITHTAANHFGAKVVCEYTGLLFDAAMGWFNARPNAANSIAGGKRPLANMGPMLLTRDGVQFAAIGAPGGRRIINAVVQVALNLVERGMNASEACSAPRIDASGTNILASERLETNLSKMDVLSSDVRFVSEQHQGYSYELARPVLVVLDADRTHAATDPYSQGYSRSLP
jgi:gamma-glutamyltranspeptidase/glutathione hydrolase